ncbi:MULTISPECIES: hypothetical protein [unclassified Flavobacterium]|uniref:hypothetical protein n=1 Tax=unclassified Flavobacterium TaxID=196869 RepID=UPI001F13760C|nr:MULTISPECIES: hypothetical protein [unclassified Flavobacterium]UMY67040.1 hypothetical protein MKO97_06590 [Flavobacterium sp. HJ-32-4]
MKLPTILFLSMLSFMASCGSGGGDGDGGGTEPNAVALVYPLNNSECETGEPVSATRSRITFEWNAAENADSYSVYVKNLQTQTVLQYPAGAATTLDIELNRATPYSWYVVSKKEGVSQTGTSEKWKFYNAGEPVNSYVPFPADAVTPPMSATVSGPSVTLAWDSGDVDDNISGYDVYFGTAASPTTLLTNTTATQVANVAVTAATTYYWKVVTHDADGNSSTSPVFQFRTN